MVLHVRSGGVWIVVDSGGLTVSQAGIPVLVIAGWVNRTGWKKFYESATATPPDITGVNFVGAPPTNSKFFSATPVGTGTEITWSVAYSASTPAWATLDTTTGVISGTPPAGITEDYGTVTLTATNLEGSDFTTFPLTAYSVQFTGTPDPRAISNSTYTFNPTASSTESGNIEFSILNKPSWAVLTPSGGLSGTPTDDNIGRTDGIVITATTNAGRTATIGPYSISVPDWYDVVVNNPFPAGVGVALNMLFEGMFDPVFSAVTIPAWATLNTATGQITGTPTSGSHLFEIHAEDMFDSHDNKFTMIVV